MTETWATESALGHALEVLAERYPGQAIEIIETFDIGWVGWECDYQGALITHDGVPELVIVDATGVGAGQPVAVTLRERLVEYGRLIVETGAVLRRYQELLLAHVYVELDKLEAPDMDEIRRRFDAAMAEMAPYFAQPGDEVLTDLELLESSTEMTQDELPPPADFVARDGTRWTLQRDLVESDDEYAARKALFSEVRRRDRREREDAADRQARGQIDPDDTPELPRPRRLWQFWRRW